MTGRRGGRDGGYGLAVSNTWPPMSAGSGRAFAALVERVPGIVALVPRLGAGPSDPAWVRRVLRHSGRVGGPLRVRTVLQHLEIVLAPLWHVVRNGRPAFVFTSQPLFSGVGALLVHAVTGAPFLVMAHGEEFAGAAAERGWLRPRARLLRATVRRAQAVVCNAELTRDLAIKVGGVPAERLYVLTPAVDVEELEEARRNAAASLPSSGRTLLIVGRLGQEFKGFDRLIEALPAVRAACADVRLVSAGPGDQTSLRGRADRLGVGEAVCFEGEVSRPRLLELFASCTVFVMPGREVAGTSEGFGLVYLEAAAFGKPVVAGRAGGTAEAVLDGVTGLLVDGEDPRAVADACIQLLSDTGLAAALGAAGRARVLAEFDSRHRGRALERVLARLVTRARRYAERAA